jgi:hypothetical protein
MKRFRPNLNEIYRQKIRHRFTLGALVSNDNAKIKSYKMIKLIMEKERMLCKFLFYVRAVMVVQKRTRGNLVAREGKIEALSNYWNQLLG